MLFLLPLEMLAYIISFLVPLDKHSVQQSCKKLGGMVYAEVRALKYVGADAQGFQLPRPRKLQQWSNLRRLDIMLGIGEFDDGIRSLRVLTALTSVSARSCNKNRPYFVASSTSPLCLLLQHCPWQRTGGVHSGLTTLHSLTTLVLLNKQVDVDALNVLAPNLVSLTELCLDIVPHVGSHGLSALSSCAKLESLGLQLPWKCRPLNLSLLTCVTRLTRLWLDGCCNSGCCCNSACCCNSGVILHKPGGFGIALTSLRFGCSTYYVCDVLLQQLRGLQDLRLNALMLESRVSSLVARLPGIRSLRLEVCGSVSDFGALARLTGLTELYLHIVRMPWMPTPLPLLQKLSLVDIHNCLLTPLSLLTQLECLVLRERNWPGEIVDVSVLSALTRLVDLRLGCRHLADVAAVESLSRLTSLDVRGCSALTTGGLAFLSRLTSLARLDLRQTVSVAAVVTACSTTQASGTKTLVLKN